MLVKDVGKTLSTKNQQGTKWLINIVIITR